MATGSLYGSTSESTGLYGIGAASGGTYFEWFVFQDSATAPPTPTGGSWNFTNNTGTPPTGWVVSPPPAPVNQVWVSIVVVDSRNVTTLSWSVPGLMTGSGLPILSASGVPSSGTGLNGQLYINTATTPQSLYFKQTGAWTQLTGSNLVDLVNNQTIGGVKTFTQTIQGNISGSAGNVSGTVAVANGGTGATTAADARTNLGLGTIATQNASAVAITGGSIAGITDLAVADGGTGASNAAQARTNLGAVGLSDTQTLTNKTISGASNTLTNIPNSALDYDSVNVNGVDLTLGAVQTLGADWILPSYTGNAGKVLALNPSASDVQWVAAAGVGTVTSIDVSGGTTGLTTFGGPITAAGAITLGGTLGVANGGTGATIAATARTNLGLGTAAVLTAGAANGAATLDAGGTIPLSQIPASIQGGVSYQGTWNASTNTPTLTSSVGTKGYYYVVSVAGSTSLNGVSDWNIGDWAIFNGTAWEKIDNTDAVTSVNGYTGSVVLTQTDIAGTASLTTTQTLTNKTLTSPRINEILDTNGNEILSLLPVASATDYVTVKNGIGVGVPLHIQADGPSASIGLHLQPKGTGLITISDGTDFNKGIRFRSSGSSAGVTTLLDAVSTAGHVVTLPDATTTLVGRNTTDTLTNKTFGDNPTFSAGTANGVAYLNGSKVLTTGSALTFDGSRLIVKGGNAGQFVLDNSNEQYVQQLFQRNGTANTGADFLLDGSGNTFNFRVLAANMPFTWHLSASAGAPLEQMRLTSTGLGIGTSSPGAKLNTSIAAGSASSTNIHYLLSETGTNSDTGMQIKATNSTNSWDAGAITFRREGAANSYGLVFATSSGGTNNNRLTLDSSGNLGLGVTPSAWGTYKAVQVANASLWGAGNNTYVGANNYFDGSGRRYIASGFASEYRQEDGGHNWNIAPSGTAGNAISFTQAMTLDSGGRLLLNRTDNVNNSRIQVLVPSSGTNQLFFTATNAVDAQCFMGLKTGVFEFGAGTGSLALITENTERARITSGGDLLVGTTSAVSGGGVLQISNGITFPATQSASSNANTLDDYEEGTWTPNQGGGLTVIGTFSSSGTYTKIGRQVTVTGRVTGATSVAVSSGGVISTNLPFTPASLFVGSTMNGAGTVTGGMYVASINVNASEAMVATSDIYFTVTYFV